MKKTFDEICNDILAEGGATNPINATGGTTPVIPVVAGGSTDPKQTTQQTNQQAEKPEPPKNSTLDPQHVLDTLKQVQNDPKWHDLIKNTLVELDKQKQQTDYNTKQAATQQTNAANQQA
jgi:membrane protein involved in colicin uptake